MIADLFCDSKIALAFLKATWNESGKNECFKKWKKYNLKIPIKLYWERAIRVIRDWNDDKIRGIETLTKNHGSI